VSMVIDHIGVVVPRLEDGLEQWTRLFGYSQLTEPVVNASQRVRVVFISKAGSTMVKLIEPTDERSPVYRLAQKGGGLQHICFRCDDLEAEIGRFREMGLPLLAGPQPGEAFEGEKIAFVFAKQGLNIELIDTDKKAKLIKRDEKDKKAS
jgi:methylmalonyl-CoA/ethylmalonyl-CoA epimerase